MQDAEYMRMALELAGKGRGRTAPNPMVGAVLVRDGRIIGQGYHARCGGLHAERAALESCTEPPRGATLYVTLEPCCHQGRQPPCTDAILAAGITRVVVGSGDPNPLVAGKDVEILRRSGVTVDTGVLQAECDALNRVFFHYIRTRRPYVTLKYAMTLDGKTPPAPGSPDGSPARRRAGACIRTATPARPSWWASARCWRMTRCSPAGSRAGGIRCASSAIPACAPRRAAG